jgi:integrase/recombinase XerD
MRVQRVLMPNADLESWAVLGDDGPIEPVDRYLAYLTAIERSPNTIKGYAHDLKDWFTYLAGRGLDWQAATLEDVAGSWPGFACRPRLAMARWRCCPRSPTTAPSAA